MAELNKIQVIKMLRDLTKCGLREAKIAVDCCEQIPWTPDGSDNSIRRDEQGERRYQACLAIEKQMHAPEVYDLILKVELLKVELQNKCNRVAQLSDENLTLKSRVNRLANDMEITLQERNEAREELEKSFKNPPPQKATQDVLSLIKRAIVDLTAGRKFDAVEKLLEALAPTTEETPVKVSIQDLKTCGNCDHYDEDECCPKDRCDRNLSEWKARIPF